MNDNIKLYFDELINKYGSEVSFAASEKNDEELKDIPFPLHSLYKFALKVNLPFGKIFTIEEALKISEKTPFKPNWFVFGRDNYFSFWICSFEVDNEGLSFTYWDHESGNEIDGAVWKDVVSFLRRIERKYEEYNNLDDSYI